MNKVFCLIAGLLISNESTLRITFLYLIIQKVFYIIIHKLLHVILLHRQHFTPHVTIYKLLKISVGEKAHSAVIITGSEHS